LSVAKVCSEVSKCSEAVEGIAEECFETPKDFQDFKMCFGEVITTTESHPDFNQVSGSDRPQIHTLEKAVIVVKKSNLLENNVETRVMQEDSTDNVGVKISKIPHKKMEKAAEVLIEAVKLTSERNQAVIEKLPSGKIDSSLLTFVKEVSKKSNLNLTFFTLKKNPQRFLSI